MGFSLSAKGSLLPFPQLEFLGMLAHLACPIPSWFLPARKAERVVELASYRWTDRDCGCSRLSVGLDRLNVAGRATQSR